MPDGRREVAGYDAWVIVSCNAVLDGLASLREHSHELRVPLPIRQRRHTKQLLTIWTRRVAGGWRIFGKGSIDGVCGVVMVSRTTLELGEEALESREGSRVELLLLRGEVCTSLLPCLQRPYADVGTGGTRLHHRHFDAPWRQLDSQGIAERLDRELRG